jgi:hypothetical protein
MRKITAHSEGRAYRATAKLVDGIPSSEHPLRSVWKNMISRCRNEKHPQYPRYGGRGINVCDRWADSFADFVADMGRRPEGTSIDRENNDLGYCPENCRWATPRQQANNTRANVLLTVDGETKTVAEWARISGISVDGIRRRVGCGWSHKDAVSQTLKKSRHWKLAECWIRV